MRLERRVHLVGFVRTHDIDEISVIRNENMT